MNSPSGYYSSNDKQHCDKQATCDTPAGFPREPVWLTDWQRRLKDQRDQRGRSSFLFFPFFLISQQEVVSMHPNRNRYGNLCIFSIKSSSETFPVYRGLKTNIFRPSLVKITLIIPERNLLQLNTRSEWTIFVCTSSNIGTHIAIWLAAAAPCMSKCVQGNLWVLETSFQFGRWCALFSNK